MLAVYIFTLVLLCAMVLLFCFERESILYMVGEGLFLADLIFGCIGLFIGSFLL